MNGTTMEAAQWQRRRGHLGFGIKFGLAWCGLLVLLGVLAGHGQTGIHPKTLPVPSATMKL